MAGRQIRAERDGSTLGRGAVWGVVTSGLLVFVGLIGPRVSCAQPPAGEARPADAAAPPAVAPAGSAHLVRIPLPLAGAADLTVRRQVEAILERTAPADPRPYLVLEFAADDKAGQEEQSGEGSQFERCLALARFLAGEEVSRLRTVAFVPHNLRGHAVLAAMACEELVVGRTMELGPAVSETEVVDETIRQGYREIANRRRTIPEPIALAMLDKQLEVYRVETLDGVRFVDEAELERLKGTGAVTAVNTVTRAGDLARLPGEDLRRTLRLASQLADTRAELSEALGIERLEEDVARDGVWRPLLLRLEGRLTPNDLRAKLRGLSDALAGANAPNLLVVDLESPGGSPADAAQLAGLIGDLDGTQVRSIAYIREARADAWLIACACDHVFVSDDAIVGGPGAPTISPRQLQTMVALARAIAERKTRDWSLTAALLDPQLVVHAYAGQPNQPSRVWTSEEHAQQRDPTAWRRGAEVPAGDGLSGAEAVRWGLARGAKGSLAEVLQDYSVDAEQLEKVRPPWTVSAIERLAAQPWLAQALLFFAFFALMSELATPGLGVAGFISGVCFLLFFWLQFLNGTAGWLELVLFLGGVLCVVVELFLLPGTGIFGIGGGVMILLSLILSSQTFVIPSNSYQVNQLPRSVFSLVAALGGGLAAIGVMRHYLPRLPVLNRLMLPPPDARRLDEREATAHYEFLRGKPGLTVTRLSPSGKARFGDTLVSVISEGELIEEGTAIVVKLVQGSRVVVRRMNES